MSNYNLDIDQFNKSFQVSEEGKFQHTKGKLLNLFPFGTDDSGLKDSIYDFKTFRGFVGDFVRKTKLIKLEKYPSREDIVEHIKTNRDINIEGVNCFSDILNSYLFDESSNLFLFNSEVLPYLSYRSKNQKLKNIGDYIFSILYDEEVKEIFNTIGGNQETNIFYRLILNILSEIGHTKETISIKESNVYKGPLSKIILNLFKKDLREIVKNDEYFVANIDKLFKHYFFVYITQLSIELNNFFLNESSPKVVMTLHWESLKKSRLGYLFGYPVFDKQIEDMFSHANCIEMLNCINGEAWTKKPFIYKEIKNQVEKMNVDEEVQFSKSVREIIELYKDSIFKLSNNKISWDDFYSTYTLCDEPYTTYSNIKELFAIIRYQFLESGRKSAYGFFKKWFYVFCKCDYIKSRGRNGNSIGINQDMLLLFTNLSIGEADGGKILLKDLWKELEERSLIFDVVSKREIVKFFQNINMLEKKSDSGDAQYVRRVGSL